MLNIYSQIQSFEKSRFKKNEVVRTKFNSWSVNLENDGGLEKTSPEDKNSYIRLSMMFIKKSFMFVEYIIRFFNEEIANKNISDYGNIFEKIDSKKKDFFAYSKDNRNWKKICQSTIHKDVLNVYMYVFHFMLSHEMSHANNPGESVDIEKKCDKESIHLLFEMILTTLNSNERGKEQKIFKILSGGILAQVIIAGITKQSLYNTEDESPKETHPYTYDRILSFINEYEEFIEKNNPLGMNTRGDDFFAYMLISMLFLYEFFGYGEFLEGNADFKTCCKQVLSLISAFSGLYSLKELFSKPRLCYDEFWGYVYWSNGRLKFEKRKDYKKLIVPAEKWMLLRKCNALQPIVIVVASPHKKEFALSKMDVLGWSEKFSSRPLNGASGKCVEKYLSCMLSHAEIPYGDKCFPIVVLNASIVQCSLGKEISMFRNQSFQRMFENDDSAFGKRNLLRRLHNLNPFLVINACSDNKDHDYVINDAISYLLFSEGFKYINCGCPKKWRKFA